MIRLRTLPSVPVLLRVVLRAYVLARTHEYRVGCSCGAKGRLRASWRVGERARVPQLGGARGDAESSNRNTVGPAEISAVNRGDRHWKRTESCKAGGRRGKNYITASIHMTGAVWVRPGFYLANSSFSFRFRSVSSGLTAMPSTHRRSCASETLCVVAGCRTWISSRVPGAIGSTQPSCFNKLKPRIAASYRLSAETSTL